MLYFELLNYSISVKTFFVPSAVVIPAYKKIIPAASKINTSAAPVSGNVSGKLLEVAVVELAVDVDVVVALCVAVADEVAEDVAV